MPGSKKRNHKKNNRFFKASRWLHIYCSTTLFALLVFFCITGIWLNHRWYNQDSYAQSYKELPLSAEQIQAWGIAANDWNPDTTAISRFLQREHGLSKPASMDMDAELGELFVEYRVPAGFATAIFSNFDELLILETEAGSAVGILNDLHKGRNSGPAWSWVIDISAGLMILFAVTGLIILFQGKKHRRAGAISALLGLATPIVIYFLFVPAVA